MNKKQKIWVGVLSSVLVLVIVLIVLHQTKKTNPFSGLYSNNEYLTDEEKALEIAKQIRDMIGNNDPYNTGSPAYHLAQQLTALGYKYLNTAFISPLDDANAFIAIPA